MINDGTMCLSFDKYQGDLLSVGDWLLESKLSRQFCPKEACADPPGKCVAGLPDKIGCAEQVGDAWQTAAVGISINACEAVCGKAKTGANSGMSAAILLVLIISSIIANLRCGIARQHQRNFSNSLLMMSFRIMEFGKSVKVRY